MDNLNWRDGVNFMDMHFKWVANQRKMMRDDPKYFSFYRRW